MLCIEEDVQDPILFCITAQGLRDFAAEQFNVDLTDEQIAAAEVRLYDHSYDWMGQAIYDVTKGNR